MKQVFVNEGRRRLLNLGAALSMVELLGCGGGSGAASASVAPEPPPAPPPPAPPAPAPPPPDNSVPPEPVAWTPSVPVLAAGTATSFDLSKTLPSSVVRGGTFGVDATGASLPAGMTLSFSGSLSVGSAAVGTVRGVIFTYETP